MKKYLILSASLLLIISAFKTVPAPPDDTAIAAFQKVSSALNSIKQISYTYSWELNYPAEGYLSTGSAESYLDYTQHTPVTGFRYQIVTKNAKLIYSGTEDFTLSEKERTIEAETIKGEERFNSSMYLNHSVATLRNVLPGIIADAHIEKSVLPDTVINQQRCYRLLFILHKQVINGLFAGLRPISKDFTFNYTITANKETNLPVEFSQLNVLDKSLVKTRFTHINTHPIAPAEATWNMAAYAKTYKMKQPETELVLIEPGKMAPDWQLTSFDSNQSVSLNQYKGKVVMLEFWFKNCGPCIEGVPELNALYQKYQNKSFQLFALNIEDTKKDIGVFKTKHHTEYPLMYGAQNVAVQYGVDACPTVVIIDKAGKVAYAGGFDKSKLVAVIDSQL
jgi:thiol-disulfide isomerase/thioredoxin